eukprot:scaffold2012_cov228-Pinguiococcus_pyrenoidosus.AAC.15
MFPAKIVPYRLLLSRLFPPSFGAAQLEMERKRVKTESSADPPKRKFKPRAPPRRLVKVADRAPPPPKPRRERETRKAGARAASPSARRPARGRGRGRGVVPRGSAFFTGITARGRDSAAREGVSRSKEARKSDAAAPRAKQTGERLREKQEVMAIDEPVDEEDRDVDDGLDDVDDDPDAPVTLDQFRPVSQDERGPLFQTQTDADSLQAEEDERIYLFQLPTVLPQLPQLPQFTKLKTEDGQDQKIKADGKQRGPAGKLLVHESGRLTLTLGGCPFEVTEGMLAAFQQEVAIVDCAHQRTSGEPNELIFLGQVTHKANVIPNYEALFQAQGGFASQPKPKPKSDAMDIEDGT